MYNATTHDVVDFKCWYGDVASQKIIRVQNELQQVKKEPL